MAPTRGAVIGMRHPDDARVNVVGTPGGAIYMGNDPSLPGMAVERGSVNLDPTNLSSTPQSGAGDVCPWAGFILYRMVWASVTTDATQLTWAGGPKKYLATCDPRGQLCGFMAVSGGTGGTLQRLPLDVQLRYQVAFPDSSGVEPVDFTFQFGPPWSPVWFPAFMDFLFLQTRSAGRTRHTATLSSPSRPSLDAEFVHVVEQLVTPPAEAKRYWIDAGGHPKAGKWAWGYVTEDTKLVVGTRGTAATAYGCLAVPPTTLIWNDMLPFVQFRKLQQVALQGCKFGAGATAVGWGEPGEPTADAISGNVSNLPDIEGVPSL